MAAESESYKIYKAKLAADAKVRKSVKEKLDAAIEKVDAAITALNDCSAGLNYREQEVAKLNEFMPEVVELNKVKMALKHSSEVLYADIHEDDGYLAKLNTQIHNDYPTMNYATSPEAAEIYEALGISYTDTRD